MGTGLADAVAASVSITIGERELLMSPLTFGDIGRFERAKGEQVINMARQSMRDLPPQCDDPDLPAAKREEVAQQERRAILAAAYAAATAYNFDGENLSAADAMLLLWLSLRHEQPDISRDELNESFDLRQPQAITEAMEQLLAISGLIEPAAASQEGGAAEAPKSDGES